MKTRPDLNKLAKETFEANKAKGFHEVERSNETLLMLVITELSEAIEADRKNKRASLVRYNEAMNNKEFLAADGKTWHLALFKTYFENDIKDTLEDELADAVIRLLDLAGLRGYKIAGDYKYHVWESKSFSELIFEVCGCVFRTQENDYIGRHIQFIIVMIESICEHLSIDLWQHVELKLKYNTTRPHKHGKNY